MASKIKELFIVGLISAFLLIPTATIAAGEELQTAYDMSLIQKDLYNRYDQNITRGEMCDVIVNIMKNINADIPKPLQAFEDTESESVGILYSAGIVNGVDEKHFAPGKSITRQELCTIIVRMVEHSVKNSDVYLHPDYVFFDDSEIAFWAKQSVDYLYYHKIIKGIDNNLAAPLNTATIEQVANIAVRLCNEKAMFVSKKKNFLDSELEWAVKPQFDGLIANTWFACGRAAVSKNGKYGYINSNGEVAVKFIYDKAYAFYDGVAKVVKDGKTGYIDCDGNIVVPLEYDDGGECCENRIWLSKDGKFGFADKNGNIVVPLKYEYAYNFSGGMAPVKKDGLYGYIDKSGNGVIDFKFQWAGAFSEDLARICEDGDFSYINRSGNTVIDGKWDYAYDFHDGRANVYDHDRDAMIDTNGNYIVNYGSFRGMWKMSEGLARVHAYSRYEYRNGYIDQSGKLLFPMDKPFFDAEDFHEGLALVSTHSNVTDRVLRSFMTKTGELILPYREKITDEVENEDDFFYMCRFSEGMAAVITQEGKLGFVKNPLFD